MAECSFDSRSVRNLYFTVLEITGDGASFGNLRCLIALALTRRSCREAVYVRRFCFVLSFGAARLPRFNREVIGCVWLQIQNLYPMTGLARFGPLRQMSQVVFILAPPYPGTRGQTRAPRDQYRVAVHSVARRPAAAPHLLLCLPT